jgi:predicted transposase/invertase (TIGR01784 family)
MFGKRDLFCQLVSAVTGDVVELDGDPHYQASLREDDAQLNSIRFDTFAWALNNKLYTADMQRTYREARQERRTIYYACRAVSSQQVKNMAYEEVNPVNISFILTDHDEKQAVRRVKLCDIETHEVYDDLLELTLVHIPAVLRAGDSHKSLYIFARFFAVSSQDEADIFVKELGMSDLGKDLISVYNSVVSNANNLSTIEASPYFVGRLTEAQLEEERQKAAQKRAIKAARKMLADGLIPDLISKYLDLDINTVYSLKPTTR